MAKISTKPPSGMRDFLPQDLRRRRHVMEVVTRIYESHGFVPLQTPTIENLSTLTGKYGDEGDQLLYRVLKRRDALSRVVDAAAQEGVPAAERDLADQGLRYDLTVPLARVVAQYGDLPRFFKRYQIQPVWRADRPGRGRFREFYQCDVDAVGSTSLFAEAEVCTAVARVLLELGFADFKIHLNHRGLLRAMVRAAKIDASLESSALVAVDKYDKIGRDGVKKELLQRGVSEASAESLLLLMVDLEQSEPDCAALMARLAKAVDEEGQQALEQSKELLELLQATPAGEHIHFSPPLARGLSYYTGAIFEITVPDLAGSLGGGGRYDELIGMFGKNSIPAVGFSLGLERILVVMAEREMFELGHEGVDLMLCWMDVPGEEVLRCAAKLREQGLTVEVFPEAAKLGKQLQYASSSGVDARFAGILGKSEVEAGELTLKNLESGEQQTVAIAEVAGLVLARG